MMVKEKLLPTLLIIQGLYYALFGIWSLVAIDSFSQFTNYRGDYFLKHTAGILFFSLGVFYLLASVRKNIQYETTVLAVFVALGIALIDFLYLPGTSSMFALDMVVEIILALLLIVALIVKRREKSTMKS